MVKHVKNWGHKGRGGGSRSQDVAHCSFQCLGKEALPKAERARKSLRPYHLELAQFQKLSRLGPG